MNQHETLQKDIESIRNLMERSVKFLSLSGLSGILAGVYALVGSGLAYGVLYGQKTPFDYHDPAAKEIGITVKLMAIALVVLILSLATGYWLSSKKAKRLNANIWDTTSKRFIINLTIPLIAGGAFILISLMNGYYGIAAPACLIFYGLALINASPNVVEEVRYLGYCEIIVGLIAASFPALGLYLWATGFGVLHIIYGTMMYKRYDR